jgi:hypothetical protein
VNIALRQVVGWQRFCLAFEPSCRLSDCVITQFEQQSWNISTAATRALLSGALTLACMCANADASWAPSRTTAGQPGRQPEPCS